MYPFHKDLTSPPDVAFPVPPSPAIGQVLSAYSNARRGDGGATRFFRGLGQGTIVNYVGEAGLQLSCKGLGEPVETSVRFEDVDRLCVERVRVVTNGVAREVFKLRFLPPGGDEPIFEIDGYGFNGAFQFATAAERAWNAYKAPRVLAEFARTGVAEFRSTGEFVVRVTADALTAGVPRTVLRSQPRRALTDLYLNNGRLYADPPLGNHAEVAGTGLGNFQVLLLLLSNLGYPLRG